MEAGKQRSVEGTVLQKPKTEAADQILGQRFPVLDHGFIALMDYMGNDSAIVQAARVSYGECTKTLRDDTGLIRHLFRHEHTSPFEMVELKFLAKMPIYIARQWIRHRTANVNEYSGRYSVIKDSFYVPAPEDIQGQSESNKQGREGNISEENKEKIRKLMETAGKQEYDWYKQLLELGAPREMARGPLGTMFYTEWYWKNDLHNIFHFLTLRLDPHAQLEIRKYAAQMAEMVKKIVPISFQAYEDFARNSVRLSSKEIAAMSSLLRGESVEDACKNANLGLTKADGSKLKSGEGPEFLQKLAIIRGAIRDWGSPKEGTQATTI